MLVSKFLSKHKLEIQGPHTPETKQLEHRIQLLITREFEKFMKGDKFNQKNLHAFEKVLLSQIREEAGNVVSIRVREATAPMTQRRAEIRTSDNSYIDGGYDKYVRNSASNHAPKANQFAEKMQSNVSLPAIKQNTRNNIENLHKSTDPAMGVSMKREFENRIEKKTGNIFHAPRRSTNGGDKNTHTNRQ